MFKLPEVFGMASAMSANAEARLGVIAENVANADTPGYRAKSVAPFQDSYQAEGGLALKVTRAGHMGATAGSQVTAVSDRAAGNMSPNGNNVSLEGQMMSAAETRQQHDLALSIYKSSLDILRASLGRH